MTAGLPPNEGDAMTIGARPLCYECKRFRSGPDDETKRPPTCDAFPFVIPLEIWDGYVDHTEPFEGDGGLQFLDRNAKPDAP